MGEKILLVEDHAPSRANLSAYLKQQGYEVAEASDGLEALRLLNRQLIDLLISDWVLPNVHGMNLVTLAHSARPTLPIIVMSGYLSKEVGTVMLEDWAEFVSKPLNLEALANMIKDLLSAQQTIH